MVVLWLRGEGDCVRKKMLVAEGEEYNDGMWSGYWDLR